MIDWLKSNLSKDFKLKVFALLVALLLEYYFYSSENSVRGIVSNLVDLVKE